MVAVDFHAAEPQAHCLTKLFELHTTSEGGGGGGPDKAALSPAILG